MTEDIRFLMAMSCLLPAIVGLLKLKKIETKYHPFIYMMVLDAVIETIFYLALKLSGFALIHQSAVNIYTYINLGLFLYFVFINNYLTKITMQLLFSGSVLTGIFNMIFSGTIFTFFFYVYCYVSAVMLIVSVDILSRQIMELRIKLVNNFWFWLSSSAVIYNAFTLLIFTLYVFAMRFTPNGKAIADIQHFVNAACYLFFTVAIFKIPEKSK